MTGEARANTFLRVFGRVCPLVLREDAGVVPDGAVSAEGLLQMTPGTFRFDLLSRPQRGRTFVLCDVDPTCRAYFALPFDGVYGPPEAERARLMTFLEAFAALRASPGLVSLFAFDVQLRARYVARWDSGEELTVQESLLYDAAFDRLRPPGCASPPKTTAPLPSEAHDPSARRVLLPEIALERDPRGRVRVLVGGRPIPMLLERTRSGTTNSGGYHDVLSTARLDRRRTRAPESSGGAVLRGLRPQDERRPALGSCPGHRRLRWMVAPDRDPLGPRERHRDARRVLRHLGVIGGPRCSRLTQVGVERDQRAAQLRHARRTDRGCALGLELPQDRETVEQAGAAALREPHETRARICGVRDALDDAQLLEIVEGLGDGLLRDPEALGELGHSRPLEIDVGEEGCVRAAELWPTGLLRDATQRELVEEPRTSKEQLEGARVFGGLEVGSVRIVVALHIRQSYLTFSSSVID
jgi:hypothetical protein